MSSSSSTQLPTLFGRGGYNSPNDNNSSLNTLSTSTSTLILNYGRDGYNKSLKAGGAEDEGRGGYN